MNDYKTALREYQELQYIIDNQINDMVFLIDKVNLFKSGILSIEEGVKISLENSSEEFNFINPIFNNFMKDIHKSLLTYNEQITVPLKNFIQSFRFATTNCLNLFNQIKINLIESKQKVTKAKDDYYNFIKSNKNSKDIKDDKNELLRAKTDNLAQLYKYEVNKMNEIITQNNKNYEDIFKTLDSIDISANSIVKNILTKFSNNISNIGNIFINFSEQLKESLNTDLKQIENNKRYFPYFDEKTKLRFNYEIFEEYNENNKNEKKESNENNTINNQKKAFDYKRIMSLPRKGFDDFEIIDDVVEMNQERMKENINKLKDIIKKLTSEKELTPLEIDELINILKEDPLENRQTFSYIFLNHIQKFSKNRVINFKNRQNFIHLANIMNNLCIKEDNTKTFNAIIEVSQMLKYENLFMFCMIQKKNHFFSTKTFWLRVIQDNLIDNINNYVNKLLNAKTNNDDKDKKVKKENKDNILVNIGLDKKINNFYKLYEKQKKEVENFAYENVCILLSKAIPGMCSFLVPEFTSIDIINHFSKQFNFDSHTKSYFHNLLEAKNIRNTSSLKKNTEKSIKKNAMFNTLFIISCTLKFLPKNEFINLLPLNKFLKPLVEKKIFKFLLSNKDLTIEKRIELWGIILKVKDSIKSINYQSVKNLLKERIEKKEIYDKSQEQRNLDTIKVDLIRTPYINKHKEDLEKVGWILSCLNYAKPDVGYCQGMNFLVLFFYQILDHDEEKTFNYMFALEIQTKYEQIFLDDLRMLKIFFIVLDKIINLYKPEIYYKFVDNYLSTNIYSTPWFVTLFTNVNCVFEKKDAPKYVLMVLENFILDGFSAIFNSGFTLTKYYFNKIMKIEGDKLINYMIKTICEEDIVKNENFNKIKELYEENSEKINELLINKLVKITRYENNHKYLTK